MNEEIARDMVLQVFSERIRTIEPDSTSKRKLLFEEYATSIASCPTVSEALSSLLEKHVVYTEEEKLNVLSVYKQLCS